MIRGCTICQRSPSARCDFCRQRVCAEHELAHDCPRAKELAEIEADPKRRKAWLAENAGEEAMTTAVVAAVNSMQEIEMAWQSRRRGGVRARDAAKAVGDVTAIARGDGIHIEVEMKGTHKTGCLCDSCAAQRDRAERVRGAGGVYVEGVRSPAIAVDGVRMGLARARTRASRSA